MASPNAKTNFVVLSTIDTTPVSSPDLPDAPAGDGVATTDQKVDSFFEAFKQAKWPQWTKILLGAQAVGTLLALIVLVWSGSWAPVPPALDYLRQAQCPLVLAFTENDLHPFTLWLPSCDVAQTGEPLHCSTKEDCINAGVACASAALRASMECAAGEGDAHGKSFCRLSVALSAATSSQTSHPRPFCLSPTPHCALYRGPSWPDGQLISCVSTGQCEANSVWECFT